MANLVGLRKQVGYPQAVLLILRVFCGLPCISAKSALHHFGCYLLSVIGILLALHENWKKHVLVRTELFQNGTRLMKQERLTELKVVLNGP